jgi:hypothetical protein
MSEVKVNKISPRTNCGTVTVGDSGDSVSVSAGVPVTVNNNLTVSGDLKSAALKAADGGSIISQCGTTITLGASGDTVSLASGASQTGFGRTGTVDWETTPKTANFTAASGEGYFINTTSGAITMTLPSGSAGAIVSVQDYNNTFDSNALTITPQSGEKINGGTGTGFIELTTEGEGLTLVYVDSTVGWRSIHQSVFADVGSSPLFVAATGGTVTTSGNFKIHTFTGPGTFTVSCAGNACGSNTVSYVVVAGAGGSGSDNAGGSGAGGYREGKSSFDCYSSSPLNNPGGLPVSAQAYPITVGGGGSGGGLPSAPGTNGSNSVFSTITSAGGGGSAGDANNTGQNPAPGKPGGSGGGGAFGAQPSPRQGGSGNTPPVSPPQGNPGGSGNTGAPAGGGGGAGGSGGNAPNRCGGGGTTSSITASPVIRSQGGKGNDGSPGQGSQGGSNTGNGSDGPGPGGSTPGLSGGSGIVVIRYKFQ